jgi:AcrR family transcriptional regulator
MARAYNMRQRAESVEATKTRILETFRELLREKLNPDAITVEETASRAGVSAMTVARHFRTKAALIDALEAWGRDHMAGVRSAPVGDAPAAIRGLFDDYEQSGDFFLRTQALEYTKGSIEPECCIADGLSQCSRRSSLASPAENVKRWSRRWPSFAKCRRGSNYAGTWGSLGVRPSQS